MPSRTISKSVENDARRLLCSIEAHFERTAEWPLSAEVNQMSPYKTATDKAGAVGFLVNQGWLSLEAEAGLGNKPRKRYVATPLGRREIHTPEALPPDLPDFPKPYPDDPAECAVYGFHIGFFQRTGRWPNGSERHQAFKGDQTKLIPHDRRRLAYQNLHKDGTLVQVYFWTGRGVVDAYVLPMYSPEYADKDGKLFYAATVTP